MFINSIRDHQFDNRGYELGIVNAEYITHDYIREDTSDYLCKDERHHQCGLCFRNFSN